MQGDTGEIRYESSNPEVATVNETSGKVSFKKPGFTIITATKAATAAYKAHSVSYALAIQDSNVKVKNPVNAPTFTIPPNLQWGTPVTFTRDSDYTYRIVPETNLVEIQDSTQKGKSEIVAVGAARVAVLATRTTDGSVVVSKQVSFGLQKGTTLKFNQTQVNVKYKVGGSHTQKVQNKTTVQGDTGQIRYESNKTDIATVDGNGTVTFKKGGDVTITATKAATNKYEKHSAQYTLTIKKLNATDPQKPIIEGAKGSWKVARAIKDYDDATYEYKSNTGNISIVNGKVEAIEKTSGTISIRKKEADTEKASQWVESDLISFELAKGTTLKFDKKQVNVQYKDGSYQQKATNMTTV